MVPDEDSKIDPDMRRIMQIPDDQELPPEALCDVMIRALESNQLLIRSSAVHQLVDLGRNHSQMAIPKILAALDPSIDYWTVRFGAIEALGYDVVAPAYVHVYWPANTDPIAEYSNDGVWGYPPPSGDMVDRVNYYGVSGVPSCFLDGATISAGQTQAAYETAFNAAAAVPSPLIINTAGSMINGISLDGNLEVYVEASDAILSTSLSVFAYFWENNINQ